MCRNGLTDANSASVGTLPTTKASEARGGFLRPVCCADGDFIPKYLKPLLVSPIRTVSGGFRIDSGMKNQQK